MLLDFIVDNKSLHVGAIEIGVHHYLPSLYIHLVFSYFLLQIAPYILDFAAVFIVGYH